MPACDGTLTKAPGVRERSSHSDVYAAMAAGVTSPASSNRGSMLNENCRYHSQRSSPGRASGETFFNVTRAAPCAQSAAGTRLPALMRRPLAR